MIDKKFFAKLKKEYDSYDINRRIIIKHSNDILKLAKQAIFSLHRHNLKEAEQNLKEAERLIAYLYTKIKKEKGLDYEGSYLAAMEEYVEAKLFYQFISKGKIAGITGLKADVDSYLGGLCDFTGELVRRATYLATNQRYKEVEICAQAIEGVVGELLQFNLIGSLRPKYDQAKHNLRKVEEIMYDLAIRNKK
jgi:predicted translin family RNA/ssDNA-binding protein